ncbi:unnamed protein product [Clavelina lepadiformis]|uniref:Uncharacterized protein n=1 Tax=Clavelina lepadiformis TaxID=159417 RepID=A0ABP0GRH1_CLALP
MAANTGQPPPFFNISLLCCCHGNDPQQVYIETTTPPVKGIKHKSVIFGLGVTEVVLGLISVTLGVILCTEGDNLRIHRGIRTPVLGEGIWCGIWFIVAGSLGIAAGCKPSGVRVMNAHLGFSIWGSVMALVLTNVGLYYVLNVQQHGRKSYYNTYKVVSTPTGGEIQDFAAIITIGIVAFLLQIVSAVCCCCATPYNCCACPCNEVKTLLSKCKSTSAAAFVFYPARFIPNLILKSKLLSLVRSFSMKTIQPPRPSALNRFWRHKATQLMFTCLSTRHKLTIPPKLLRDYSPHFRTRLN